MEYSLGWAWGGLGGFDHSTVSGAYSPHLRLPCAARPRPKYAQQKLPLEMYGGDPDAVQVLGSWVLLETSTVEQMDGGGAAATWGASRAGRERRLNVTLIDHEG